MKYHNSIHFREDPYQEVDAALAANTPESVEETLRRRLLTEQQQTPLNEYESQRARQQLEYLGALAIETAA